MGNENARTSERKSGKLFRLRAMILIVCIFLVFIIVCGLVLAEDTSSYSETYFKSAKEGISYAAKNGYIQNKESEFVYDQDIGIRIDNIVLDDFNLNIIYEYNYISNIESVFLQEYEIIDNNENIIYKQSNQYNKTDSKQLTNNLRRLMEMEIKENTGLESIVYSSEKYPIIEKIYIHISKISINNQEVTGNWNLEVNIDSQFNKRENIEYKIDNTEHILDYKIIMSETALRIYIEIDDVCDGGIFEKDRIILEDSKGERCKCHTYSVERLENSSICHLDFDIGKNSENIEEMFLNIKANDNTNIQTKLSR